MPNMTTVFKEPIAPILLCGRTARFKIVENIFAYSEIRLQTKGRWFWHTTMSTYVQSLPQELEDGKNDLIARYQDLLWQAGLDNEYERLRSELQAWFADREAS